MHKIKNSEEGFGENRPRNFFILKSHVCIFSKLPKKWKYHQNTGGHTAEKLTKMGWMLVFSLENDTIVVSSEDAPLRTLYKADSRRKYDDYRPSSSYQ